MKCVVCGASNTEIEIRWEGDLSYEICIDEKPCLARKASLERHPSRTVDNGQ